MRLWPRVHDLIKMPAFQNVPQIPRFKELPMISELSKGVAERAKAIYSEQLQYELEANHLNRFVAIEPNSGDHFLADSFSQAVAIARSTYPDRISFVIRIGHETAIRS